MKKKVDVFVFGSLFTRGLIDIINGKDFTEATAMANPDDYDLSKCAVIIKGDVMIDDIQVRSSIAATGCMGSKGIKVGE